MVTIRGNSDECLQAVAGGRAKYENLHPNADVVVYRQNSVAVRVRIVDPDFDGLSKADRHDIVWDFLKDLPEDQQSEITVLLLLTPHEVKVSFANYDFDNPIPSRL